MTSKERPGLKRMIAWTLDLLDRSLDGSDGRGSDADDSAEALRGRAQPKRGLVVAGARQEGAAREAREKLVEGLAAVEALGRVLDAVKGPSVRKALSLPRAAENALSARSGLLDLPAASGVDDDGFAERHALALARGGRARLQLGSRLGSRLLGSRLGSTGSSAAGSVGVLGSKVPEESLLRLLRGELDAFRAAEVAGQASRHAGTREELILLASRDAGGLDAGGLGAGALGAGGLGAGGLGAGRLGAGRLGAGRLETGRPEVGRLDAGRRSAVIAPLRLAADGPTPIRDPAQGVLVAKGGAKATKNKATKNKTELGKSKAGKGSAKRTSASAPSSSLEAFRFADGVVAIYAARPLPLTLVEGRGRGASSPRVVGSAPGYLELSLPRAQKRTLSIQVGLDDAELVELELT